MSELTMSEVSADQDEEIVVSFPDASLDALIGQIDASWHDPADVPGQADSLPADPAEPDQLSPSPQERRGAARRAPEDFKAELRLAVAGSPMRLVNLSSTGLLAETNQRLCPGRRVDVFLRYGGARKVLRATVVRSSMHAVTPTPVFRAALQFEEQLALPDASL
jgi:hypothetical protein